MKAGLRAKKGATAREEKESWAESKKKEPQPNSAQFKNVTSVLAMPAILQNNVAMCQVYDSLGLHICQWFDIQYNIKNDNILQLLSIYGVNAPSNQQENREELYKMHKNPVDKLCETLNRMSID